MTTTTRPPTAGPVTRVARRRLMPSRIPRIELALVIAITVSWVCFSVVGHGFTSSYSVFQLGQLIASSLLIGLAQLVVLVIGRLNLAVGAIGVVCVMLAGNLMLKAGVPSALAIVLAIAAGVVVGALIGLVEANTSLGSFVVTLAALSVLQGAMYVVTRAQPTPLPTELRVGGAAGFISPYISVLLIPALLLAAGLGYLYGYTPFGRRATAVGFNEKAAVVSGVRVKGVIITSFAISGALCAIAAIVQSARIGAVLPSLGGDWVIASFIVPVLGGTALTGGHVSVRGAVLGAIFINTVNTGLISVGLPSTWLILTQGLVLLVVLLLQTLVRERRR